MAPLGSWTLTAASGIGFPPSTAVTLPEIVPDWAAAGTAVARASTRVRSHVPEARAIARTSMERVFRWDRAAGAPGTGSSGRAATNIRVRSADVSRNSPLKGAREGGVCDLRVVNVSLHTDRKST